MTHASCPDCRLRFAPAMTAALPACPECGEPLQALGALDQAVGLRLFHPDDPLHGLAEAIAAAMPLPAPRDSRS